jgi:hypothetical protein
MRNTAKAVTTALLLAVGLLSGCTHAQPESTPAAAPPPLSEPAVDMVTRSGSYPDQLWRVTTADEKLTEQCMRAAGFTWAGGARPPARHSGAEALADARQNGYGMSDTAPPPTTATETHTATDDDRRLRVALLGPDNDLAQLAIDGHAAYWFPRTGCAAQAHIAIYGSLDNWARISYIPQEINLTLSDQAQSDPRYQTTLQHWKTCMATHNYTYASPTDILNELATKYRTDPEPLTQRRSAEITIAVQDLTCDQQVGLTSTQDTLRRDYAQQLDPSDRAELTRLTQLFTQARQRASLP